jgi:RHS repeat-associated protein
MNGTKLSKLYKVLIPFLILVLLGTACGGSSSTPKPVISEQYSYDDAGRLSYKILPSGEKVSYKYDANGQLTAISGPGLKVQLAYDAQGNTILMEDNTGKTEYKYDELNRPTEIVYQHSPKKTIRYEYDPWNRVTALKLSNENNEVVYQVNYDYDMFGNLLVINDGTERIEYSYDLEKGETVRYLPNGVKSFFSFSPSGELLSLKHFDRSGNIIASYQYDYDAANRVIQVQEETPQRSETTHYQWDNRCYLSSLTWSDGNISYQYDAMGNRISQVSSSGKTEYQYDGFGRIVKSGDYTFEHDVNGNLNHASGPGHNLSFEYDIAGQLIRVQSIEGKAQYRYDGRGSLIWSSSNDDESSYLPYPLAPPGFVLAEYTNDSDRYYTYGENLICCRDTTNGMTYFLEDGFNSLRFAVDQEGRTIGQRDYSPFGEVTLAQGEMPGDFRTAGERYLPEAGLYLVGNRPYDAQTGRYLTPDSTPPELARFDTFNRYAHGCRNAGVFMAPRCHQTTDVFVGGVNHRQGDVDRMAARYLGPNSVGIAVNSGPKLFIPDLMRAALDQVFGGKLTDTDENLLPKLLAVKNIGHLMLYSQGAITTGNLASQLVTCLKDGTISIEKVTFVGAYPDQNLVKGLQDLGIPCYLKVAAPTQLGGVGPYATKYYDPIWVYLMTSKEIGKLIAPDAQEMTQVVLGYTLGGLWKIGALISALSLGILGPYSFTAHTDLDFLLPAGGDELKSDQQTPVQEDKIRIEQKFPPFPVCPPFCDDHDGGGGAATISLPYTPLPAAEDELGGIDLGTTMRLTGDFDLGYVTGAVWDEGNQTLVLLGEKTTALPSISASDLAVALKSIFISHEYPAFSLDPADPANPFGPYQQAVYYGPMEGTNFGQAMFDADWKLKEYSFGVSRDENGQIQEILSEVPGYKDIFDLNFEREPENRESCYRFWITPEDLPVYQKDGALYFGNIKMKVNTEKMYQAGKQGLVSSGGKQDPSAEKFAAHFTEHYDEFASEEPAFARVRELAKAVALAKWLYEQNIPIDMSWVDQCLAASAVDTPKLVPTLSREETREYQETKGSSIYTITRSVTLIGGVDLAIKPRSVAVGQELSELASKVKQGLSNDSPVFDIAQADKDLQAVVLPLTPTGKSIWGQREYVEQDGIKYYSTNDEVTKAVDDYGSTTEFDWTPDGKPQMITWNLGGGYEATAKRASEGDTLEVTTPEGNHISYSYDTSGRLDEVKVNGATYARLSSSGDTLEVNYGEYAERFVTDNKGRVTSYESEHIGSQQGTRTFSLTYDELNNIAKLSGSDTGEMAFIYSGGKLSEVQLPGDKISYYYDAQDRLQSMSVASGKAAEYSYEGDQVAEILLRSGERSAAGVFEEGHLIEYKDFFGATTKYEYTADGMLSCVTDPLGLRATYEYNETGHLTKVNLPNGNIIQYKYDPKAQNRLIGIDIFPSESVFEQFMQSALPSLTIKVRAA